MASGGPGRVLRPSLLLKALCGLLMSLLLVLLTSNASGEHPSESVRSVLAGERVRLALPPTNEPKGVAIYFHGQGGNVNDRVDGPWLEALRRDGWAIATSSFHGESWGNPASTDDTRRLVEWAREQGGAPVKLFIGGSMGATVSLNAMLHGGLVPTCWYGVKAALDPRRMDAVPGAEGYIRKAYGGAAVPLDRIPVENYLAMPLETRYRFVASPRDQFVDYAENTGRLLAGLQGRGAEVSVRKVDGRHDDPSHYSAYDLVTFARGCV